ncbi:hypothetical protein DICSQDRAFT_71331 [Dichomitus squalens LYAD-421 SS1]|uniref:GAG-pre-integrase domain-containing protein n=1 Tax=Dichomitus squalens (strain LYAD-421) TaxID=732165 RepID=R7SKU6_DICSQ|nr:uncharacterized protein DICSQDRAFT_71331 [Dichomitus squalens LYAD-421 SS1]EJF56493.1 hypothetical protein DICSQDRAFT_71331 [Dichomitus squalens LYAD-421 SS1]
MFLQIPAKGDAKASVQPAVTYYWTWHRRLGHPSKEAISRLPANSKGVDHIDPPPANAPVCEGCEWGKSHRLPFPPSEKRATVPCKLIHTDEDGPMGTESINRHNLHYVSFLDDCSGVGRTYFLRHRNQAHQAFHEFKAWAETSTVTLKY